MKVKVCGMKDLKNIQSISSLNIDYMGFIFYENSTRYTDKVPNVDLPDSIKKVGVFVNSTGAYIEEKIVQGIHIIQLHGNESPSFCKSIKKYNLPIIKAFGISDAFQWNSLEPYLNYVDYFLFDTKSPNYGGTGLTFNWSILNNYKYDKPYFLSGGLSLENIKSSLEIKDSRLAALDLNSKFEIYPGLKDSKQLEKALKILKNE